MFSIRLVAATAALALAFPAFAADDMVKSIDVQTELTALTNVEAAKRFATFDADLEAAITARLVDRIAEKGVDILIDISEVELSNSLTEKLNLAETRLVGDVKITDEEDNSNFDAYQLTVDVNTATPFFPAGTDVTVLPMDSDAYYDAMIAAFADTVAQKLEK